MNPNHALNHPNAPDKIKKSKMKQTTSQTGVFGSPKNVHLLRSNFAIVYPPGSKIFAQSKYIFHDNFLKFAIPGNVFTF